MLFDLHPKETPETLFGRTDDLERLLNHLRQRRWLSLLGPRMVGKTSLVRAAGHSLAEDDVETLYVSLWGSRTLRDLLDGLLVALESSGGLYRKVKRRLRQVEGLTVGPVSVSLREGGKPVSLAGRILSLLGSHAKRLVIFLDEVQELSDVSVHLHRILANVFATRPNITFCFTGSHSGLVRALQSPGPESPLYGRSPALMKLSPFDTETARDFLEAGFSEQGQTVVAPNLDDVVERFGGIPGWLTNYGNSVVVSGLSHIEALRWCEQEAFKTTRQTLEHYLKGRHRQNHVLALRAIALRSSWSQIRGAIEANTGEKLNDGSLKNIIDSLHDAFFVEKIGAVYVLIDPVMQRYSMSGQLK